MKFLNLQYLIQMNKNLQLYFQSLFNKKVLFSKSPEIPDNFSGRARLSARIQIAGTRQKYTPKTFSPARGCRPAPETKKVPGYFFWSGRKPKKCDKVPTFLVPCRDVRPAHLGNHVPVRTAADAHHIQLPGRPQAQGLRAGLALHV